MRIGFVAALVVFAVVANAGQSIGAAAPTPVKIKEEILGSCGGFPYAPTIAIEPKTATIEDMKQTRKAVTDYISEVSYYEKCLLTLEKTLGPRLSEKDTDYIVFVFNRAQEERDVLSLDFNKLVDAYNKANGIITVPDKPAKPAAKPAAAKPAVKPAITP